MKSKHAAIKIMGGAGLLTLTALVSKILGAVYRIPLTRAVGAHGMGIYMAVFPSYALIVTLTGGGLTSAVSKITASSEDKTQCALFAKAALIFSVPVTLAAAVSSKFIAAASGAPEAAVALMILLSSVPVSSVCAVLRGYFQGLSDMKPSAIGQLTEQAVKLVSGLTLAFLLVKHSVTAAVAGCSAGVALGEAAALLYYLCVYGKHPSESAERDKKGVSEKSSVQTDEQTAEFIIGDTLTEISAEIAPSESEAATLGTAGGDCACGGAEIAGQTALNALRKLKSAAAMLFKASLPITLAIAVLPLCQVADSFTVVNLLVKSGAQSAAAKAAYGTVTGPVNSLINLPAVFTVGICGFLLPKISRLVSRGESISKPAVRCVVCAAVTGAVFFAALFFGARLALKILYGSGLGVSENECVRLLEIASVSVPFAAVMQTAGAVLQGGGKAYVAALNLLVAAAVKESLNFLLLPHIGIYGFVIAGVAFFAVACALDLAAMIILIKKQENLCKKTSD